MISCLFLILYVRLFVLLHNFKCTFNAQIYRVSLSLEAPNYCLCIQSKSAGFSFVNTGRQVHLKHARRHFERKYGERRAPSKCCIQKLVKKLETKGSRSNACRLLSFGPTEGQSVKNTRRTIEQLKDAIRQEIQAVNVDTLGKVLQNIDYTCA